MNGMRMNELLFGGTVNGWVDEALNRCLRDVCGRVHKAHQEIRVMMLFAMQGALGLSEYLFGDVELE